jgi:hypothetical protein
MLFGSHENKIPIKILANGHIKDIRSKLIPNQSCQGTGQHGEKALESGIVADSGRGIFSLKLLIHALRFLHLLRHRFRKEQRAQSRLWLNPIPP